MKYLRLVALLFWLVPAVVPVRATVTSQVDKTGPFLITSLPQTIPTGFPFVSGSELLVLDTGPTSAPYDPARVLTLGSDYTVTGGGYNAANQMQTGSIIVVGTGAHAVAANDYLVIMRNVPINQTSSFTSTGPLTVQLIEQALDKQATLSQQVNEVAGRALQFENFEFLNPTLYKAARKNKVLGFDANGAVQYLDPQAAGALGTMAYQNSDAVAITGGNITGITHLTATGAAGATANVFNSSYSPTYAGAFGGTSGFRTDTDASGTTAGDPFYNSFNINSDTVAASGGALGFYIGHNFGGGSASGPRTGFFVRFAQTGILNNGAGATDFYAAQGVEAQANYNAGGTDISHTTGGLFGSNIITKLQTGATWWNEACSQEVDLTVQEAVPFKEGLKIVSFTDDAIRGTYVDTAFAIDQIAESGHPGWLNGIQFGTALGWWPFRSDSTLIGTQAATIGGGPAMQANHGIDLSAVTFTTDAFKSNGYQVLPNGDTIMGQAEVGTYSTTYAIFANKAVFASSGNDFALQQGWGGDTYLNSKNGSSGTHIRYANVDVAHANGTGFLMDKPFVEKVSALTYASPTTVTVTNGNVFTVTTVDATGSVTFNASGAGTAGQHLYFIITNDGTSGKTITFGTNFKPSGTLVGTTSKTATIEFISDGSSLWEVSRTTGL